MDTNKQLQVLGSLLTAGAIVCVLIGLHNDNLDLSSFGIMLLFMAAWAVLVVGDMDQ